MYLAQRAPFQQKPVGQLLKVGEQVGVTSIKEAKIVPHVAAKSLECGCLPTSKIGQRLMIFRSPNRNAEWGVFFLLKFVSMLPIIWSGLNNSDGSHQAE
jgi:hypothetical protein